jgi:integrase
MSTYQDKRTKPWRWRYAFMHEGRRYSGSAPLAHNTQRTAEALEKERAAKVSDRQFVGVMPTLNDFAKRFLDYQGSRNATLTHESQTVHIDQHVLPELGRRKLDAIAKRDIDHLVVRWKKQGAAPRTINARLGTFARLLAVAKEWKYLREIPEIDSLTVPSDTPRFLTELEAASILAAAEPHWHSMILTGLRTGLRIGELRGLQWGDIDLTRARSIQVRRTEPGRPDLPANAPKGKRERTAPLTPDALTCLESIRPEKPATADWVWPALLYRGKPRSEQGLRARSSSGCFHGIRYAVDHATPKIVETEDDAIAWHTLRHTFASWLVIRGTSLRVVQDLLGHASIRQTERYSHLAPNLTHHAAVAALDYAFSDPDYKPITNALPDGDRERNDDA